MQHAGTVTLNPDQFRKALIVIDAVDQKRKPDRLIIEDFSDAVDRFTADDPRKLDKRDPLTIEAIKKVIISVRTSWFVIPKSRFLTRRTLFDFLRAIRKKLRTITNLTSEVRASLRCVCLAMIRHLPAVQTARA